MKSVLKTFSQSTGNLLTKVCLAVLCVFVFSSMGNAQSFMEATDAQQVLRPIMETLNQSDLEKVPEEKVKVLTDNGVVIVDNNIAIPANLEDAELISVRKAYYASLAKYIDWVNYSNVVSNAIERNHQFMLMKRPGKAALLEEIKLEVTDLLTI